MLRGASVLLVAGLAPPALGQPGSTCRNSCTDSSTCTGGCHVCNNGVCSRGRCNAACANATDCDNACALCTKGRCAECTKLLGDRCDPGGETPGMLGQDRPCCPGMNCVKGDDDVRGDHYYCRWAGPGPAPPPCTAEDTACGTTADCCQRLYCALLTTGARHCIPIKKAALPAARAAGAASRKLLFMPPSPVIPGVCQAYGWPCTTVAECTAVDGGCTHCVQKPAPGTGGLQGGCQADMCGAPCATNADGTPGSAAGARAVWPAGRRAPRADPCDSCNSGACLPCKSCVGVKTGQCAACYTPDPTLGTACLYDDGHGCQKCWAPAPPAPAPSPSPGHGCADPKCDACCTGVCLPCKACVGVKTGQCASCYAIDPSQGTACLYDDGHGCQRCWNAVPTPPGPSPPGPAPAPSPGHGCADPQCDACCTGVCLPCKACVGVKTGQCAACYAVDPSQGTACLYDDGHGCQRCWNAVPTPPGPAPAPSPPDPACAICDTGACAPCKPCVGKDTGSCASCWAINPTTGTACLYPDGHGCLKCWNKNPAGGQCTGKCDRCNSGLCESRKCRAPCGGDSDCDDKCRVCHLGICLQCQKEDKSCVPDDGLLGASKPCCPGLECVQDKKNPDKMKCHKSGPSPGPAPPAPVPPGPPAPPCVQAGKSCESNHDACCDGLECQSSHGKHVCEKDVVVINVVH